ncbi:MAG: hypothetical protein M0041_01705 [Nitrospiraceae bacterium]|nr:hypothetical protein [Nitrospiraceae bacterium]
MPILPKTGKRNMSANAVRVARHAAKMRSQGKKKLSLWVTPEEEQFIRAFILEPQRRQRERENR